MDSAKKEGSDKGKAKDSSNRPEDASKGLASRIADSAKGLLQDTLAPGADTVQILGSSSAFGAKAQSSGAATPAAGRAQDLGSSQRGGYARSGEGSLSGSGLQGSFRTQSFDPGLEAEAEEFVTSKPEFASHDTVQTGDFETSWQTATAAGHGRSYGAPPAQTSEVGGYDDGAEVRALLADPAFNVDAESELAGFDDGVEQNVDDLFPQDFSTEEQSRISTFRASLPQPPIHRPTDPNHPLSLRPRSDEENKVIEENIQGILDGTFTERELQGDEWLDSWLNVLNGYTDEVWGDMLAVVRETKQQLEEVKKGGTQVDGKAVARLKMILGHLEMNR
jgi:hypothetical protein